MKQIFIIHSEKGLDEMELLGMLEESDSKATWKVREVEK